MGKRSDHLRSDVVKNSPASGSDHEQARGHRRSCDLRPLLADKITETVSNLLANLLLIELEVPVLANLFQKRGANFLVQHLCNVLDESSLVFSCGLVFYLCYDLYIEIQLMLVSQQIHQRMHAFENMTSPLSNHEIGT